MTKHSVIHGSFTIERLYDFPPAMVFAAWAQPEAKAEWFAGPKDWEEHTRELDFREGGRERLSGGPKEGPVHHYHALYFDIVPGKRIIYSYEMHLDKTRISVSLATVEFKPSAGGTKLIFTEQGAFVDGFDGAAGREEGTRGLLEQLNAALTARAA